MIEKMKADVQKINASFPPVPPGAEIKTLTDAEFKQLVMATNSYEKTRTYNLITALQAQLMEHQSLIDRLEASESERKKLAERNDVLEKENAEQGKRIKEQDERLLALEEEVIDLKLDLANEKGKIDHTELSVHQLSARNTALENENQDLKNRLSASAENGENLPIRNDFKLISSMRRRPHRATFMGDLASSTRTNITDASTETASSLQSSISERFFRSSLIQKHFLDASSSGVLTESNEELNEETTESPLLHFPNRSSEDSLTESSEEASKEKSESPLRRNLARTTRGWASERVIRPRGNNFGYY